MSSFDLDCGIRIKINSIWGGYLKNLNYCNIDIGMVKDVVVVNFFYEEGDVGNFFFLLEDIIIENLNVVLVNWVFVFCGYDYMFIFGLMLNNIMIKCVFKDVVIENVVYFLINNVFINS